MSPILKYIESFTVSGLNARTSNRDEFNEKTAVIPALWQRFFSSDLPKNRKVFGVYSDFESDENGFYTLTVGIASDNSQGAFHTIKIQTGHYLIFKGTGPMPATVITLWQQVWEYFKQDNLYQRNFISDFESYIDEHSVAIYIGVK